MDGYVGVNVVSLDLNSKMEFECFLEFRPTTHVEKGDGKSLDWIDDLKLPDHAKIHFQNTDLLFNIRSGSEGPSRDVAIGAAIVRGREVLCRATLTAHCGVPDIVPYRVVSPSGKPIGTLKVSFKFDDMVAAPSVEAVIAAARELSQGFDEVAREPVTKYPAPAGPSMAYAGFAPPPPQQGYRYPPAPAVYAGFAPPPAPAVYAGFAPPPPPQGYGYPPAPAVHAGFAPPPPPQGYGYPPQGYGYPPQGHGYPPQQVNNNNFGAKLGALLLRRFAPLAFAVADVGMVADAAGSWLWL